LIYDLFAIQNMANTFKHGERLGKAGRKNLGSINKVTLLQNFHTLTKISRTGSSPLLLYRKNAVAGLGNITVPTPKLRVAHEIFILKGWQGDK